MMYANDELSNALNHLNIHMICFLCSVTKLVHEGKVLGRDKSQLLNQLSDINTDWQSIPNYTLPFVVRCLDGEPITKDDISDILLPLCTALAKVVQDEPVFLAATISSLVSLLNIILSNCNIEFLVNYLTDELNSSALFAESIGKILQYASFDKCAIWSSEADNPYWGFKNLIRHCMTRLPKHLDMFLFLFAGAMPNKNFTEMHVTMDTFGSLFSNSADFPTITNESNPVEIVKQILFSPLMHLVCSSKRVNCSSLFNNISDEKNHDSLSKEPTGSRTKGTLSSNNSKDLGFPNSTFSKIETVASEKLLIVQDLILQDLGFSQYELIENWDRWEFGQRIICIPIGTTITYENRTLSIDLKNAITVNRHYNDSRKHNISFSIVHMAWLAWHAIRCKKSINRFLSACNAFFSRLIEIYPTISRIMELVLSTDFFPDPTSTYLFGPANFVYHLGRSYQDGVYMHSITAALKAVLEDDPELATIHCIIFLYGIEDPDYMISSSAMSNLIDVISEHVHDWNVEFSTLALETLKTCNESYTARLEYYFGLRHNFNNFDVFWQISTLTKLAKNLNSNKITFSRQDVYAFFSISDYMIEVLIREDLPPHMIREILLALGQTDLLGLAQDVIGHELASFSSGDKTVLVTFNQWQRLLYTHNKQKEWGKLYKCALKLLTNIVKISPLVNVNMLDSCQTEPNSVGLVDSLIAGLCLSGFMESHGTAILKLLLELGIFCTKSNEKNIAENKHPKNLCNTWGMRIKPAINYLMTQGKLDPCDMFKYEINQIDLTDLLCHFCLHTDPESPNPVQQEISQENKCLILKILATDGFDKKKYSLLVTTLLETNSDISLIHPCLELDCDFPDNLLLDIAYRLIEKPDINIGKCLSVLIKHATKNPGTDFGQFVFKNHNFVDAAISFSSTQVSEDILNQLLLIEPSLTLKYGMNALIALQNNAEPSDKLAKLLGKTLPLATAKDFNEFAKRIDQESLSEVIALIIHKSAMQLVLIELIPTLVRCLSIISSSWFELTMAFTIRVLSVNLKHPNVEQIFCELMESIPDSFFQGSNDIQSALLELVDKASSRSLDNISSIFKSLTIAISKGSKECKNAISKSKIIQLFYEDNMNCILNNELNHLEMHLQVLQLACQVLEKNALLNLSSVLMPRMAYIFTDIARDESDEALVYTKLLTFLPSYSNISIQQRVMPLSFRVWWRICIKWLLLLSNNAVHALKMK